MSIVKHEGKTFTGQTFELEECWFVNCVLRDCTIFYSGGSYEMENTQLQNCSWKFHDNAQRTCQLLNLIGLLPPPQANPQMALQPSGPPN